MADGDKDGDIDRVSVANGRFAGDASGIARLGPVRRSRVREDHLAREAIEDALRDEGEA